MSIVITALVAVFFVLFGLSVQGAKQFAIDAATGAISTDTDATASQSAWLIQPIEYKDMVLCIPWIYYFLVCRLCQPFF